MDSLRYLWYGKYITCYFMLFDETDVKLFSTRLENGTKGYIFLDRSSCEKFDTHGSYLLLPLDEEETRKVMKSCEACVIVNKPLNVYDILAIHLPFREPVEIPLCETPSLNDIQSIILILRECLNPDNKLRHGLEGLSSRNTLPVTLYDRLRPYTLPVLMTDMADLVKWRETKHAGTVHESKPSTKDKH